MAVRFCGHFVVPAYLPPTTGYLSGPYGLEVNSSVYRFVVGAAQRLSRGPACSTETESAQGG
jgi:hypothetical protein